MGHYTMHGLLHDFARAVSLGECLRLVPSSGNKYDIQTVRHLWIVNFSKLTILEIKALSHSKHLRTLVVEDSHVVTGDHIAPLEKAVKNLKCLRLLILKNIGKFHFSKKVANKHLRYLHFSGIKDVGGFSKLYHLQVLTVSDSKCCYNKEEMKELGSIPSLRYVSYGDKGFGVFPVGGLHSLQELHDFRISFDNQISSLSNLSSLLELKVSFLEHVRSNKEVEEANLKGKQHLKSLSLSWSAPDFISPDSVPEPDFISPDSILEKLEPHGKLEKLEISAYSGQELPTWINNVSLTKLVSLQLRQCVNWLNLPDLGKLKILKHLELEKLTRLEYIGQSSEESLPPNMTSLVVEDCKNLSILPVLPLSLVQLKIKDVGLTNLPRMSNPHDGEMGFEGTLPRLLSVIINCCPKLRSLEGSFLQQEHCIRGLRILNIVDCRKLESASLLFGEMNDLTGFHIGRSYNLKMKEKMDGGLLPDTLKQLSIDGCGELQGPLLESLPGLANLTSLQIHRCSMNSLPSSEVFKSLAALRILVVDSCLSLTSLGGLGALSHLTWLRITDCENLSPVVESGEMDQEFSLQVYLLWVDTISLLNMQPLRRLCNTNSLIITCSIENIPRQWLKQNRESLESLEIDKPFLVPTMKDFCSLKRLDFHYANDGTLLPALPTSLDYFIVGHCDEELKQRWTRKKSSEWNMISRIPFVRIGSAHYKHGKKSEPF